MSQQPELISPSLPANPASEPGEGMVPVGNGAEAIERHGSMHAHQRVPRWLEKAELFLRVLLRMVIGIAVCYAPWLPMLWDQNPLFSQFPTLGAYAAHGAVRGMVSGLGLLNLWMAFQDAIRHGTDKG
jgi:hypothetical protein